jgi:hypothetical protein
MKYNSCLHIMYLSLVVGSMVFIAMNELITGWSLFVAGMFVWAVMLGLEINKNETNK